MKDQFAELRRLTRSHLGYIWQMAEEPTLTEIYDILQTKVVAFPKPKDGSGFPARVFAILP